jgi:AcrR family transcriptional regulator
MDNPPLTRHQKRRQQTRQLLIDTTLQLILEKGFDAITVQDITDRADLGRGTFYIHFKDKEEIVWIMFRELMQDLEKEAHASTDRTRPQFEYYGFRLIFRHAGDHRDLYRIMLGEKGSPSLTARIQEQLAAVLLRDIRNPVNTPEPNFNLPEELEAQILTGALTSMLTWWLGTANDYSAERMAGVLYSAFYRQYPPAD